MSKYKPLDAPITRREACLIIDRKRFDAAVRAHDIEPLGKMGGDGEVVSVEDGALTAPIVFDQSKVRKFAEKTAADLATEGRDLRLEAKEVAKKQPPLTRRQVAQSLGSRLTGILIRNGRLVADGALTDTQTAAHTYKPEDVAEVVNALADERYAEAKLIKRSSKTRIPK